MGSPGWNHQLFILHFTQPWCCSSACFAVPRMCARSIATRQLTSCIHRCKVTIKLCTIPTYSAPTSVQQNSQFCDPGVLHAGLLIPCFPMTPSQIIDGEHCGKPLGRAEGLLRLTAYGAAQRRRMWFRGHRAHAALFPAAARPAACRVSRVRFNRLALVRPTAAGVWQTREMTSPATAGSERFRPVAADGRTQADWHQAVVGQGDRCWLEWRLYEVLRP